MTIGVLQERQTSVGAATSSNIALAFSSAVTLSSSLHTVGCSSDGGVSSLSCADNLNGSHGTALDNIDASNSSDLIRGAQFKLDGSAAGSCTVTITPNAAAAFRGIVIREIGGTSGYDTIHSGAYQIAPGSGANAISAGSATPLNQPGLCSAITFDPTNPTTVPTAGSGFTAGISCIDFGGGSNGGLTEHKRYTALTAFAATWTCSAGTTDNYLSFAAYFKEAAAAAFVPDLVVAKAQMNALLVN